MATTTSDNIRLNQIIDNGLNIYGSREKIRTNLIDLAKRYLNISKDSDISKASYLTYIIDMLSILSSNQIYYQSKLYNEFFLVTAQMNESVQNLAKWIGYTIPKATCANVSVMFTIPLKFTVDTINFNFNKYFQCRAGSIPFTIKSNGTLFDTKSSASFSLNKQKLQNSSKGQIVNNSAIVVKDYNGAYRPVYISDNKDYCAFTLEFEQCKYEIQTFNIPEDLQLNQFYQKTLNYSGQVSDIQIYMCSPSNGQTLQLNGTQLDNIQNIEKFDPTESIIDSSGQLCSFVQWLECVNGIYTISSTSKEFDWLGYYNKGIISFGNGILGAQPIPGSLVVAVMKITEGSAGNVIDNTVTDGDELTIKIDSTSKANVSYECKNNNAAHGGIDILSTSEVKNNAIVNLKARKRLVADDDYNNILDVVPGTTLSDCVPILKRSDIKVNDITLYFILNYLNNSMNEIVPTRNVQYDLIEPKWDDNNQLTIVKQSTVEVGPEKLPFCTIFNMILDKPTRMAAFNYTATNVQGVASEIYSQSVYDTLNQATYINSTTTDFSINFDKNYQVNDTYPVVVKLNLNNLPNKILYGKDNYNTITDSEGRDRLNPEYKWNVKELCRQFKEKNNESTLTTNSFEINRFKAVMTTKWGDHTSYDDTSSGSSIDVTEKKFLDNDTKKYYCTRTYESFTFQIPSYKDVPMQKQRYEFQIMCYAPKTDDDGYMYCIRSKDCKEVRAIDPDGNYYSSEGADVTDPVVMQWKPLKKYYSDVIINQDLSDCMQSAISIDNKYKGHTQYKFTKDYTVVSIEELLKDYTKQQIQDMIDDGTLELANVYHVHEVPAIYQPYYNEVMYKENSDFELSVIQKLLENVNFSSVRMMTDFTNIKFADTYASLKNLMYNNYNYMVESRYNHTPWWEAEQGTKSFPTNVNTREYKEYVEPDALETPIYYIANGKIDSMGNTPVSEYYGYIALRVPTIDNITGEIIYNYSLITPAVGDCIKIKDELDCDGNMQTCYWTGHEWMPVEQYTIPLKLSLKVQVNEDTVATSDDALKEQIIDVLSEYYNDTMKMGLQREIDRSEITRVCRSIEGVEYVEVLNPQFDIKFDYEVNDLTQEQLLMFTPQYIGFRTLTGTVTDYKETSISIEIVRK